MSLWTPSGEHEVPRSNEPPTGRPSTSGEAGDDWRERLASGEIGIDDLTAEQRAEVEEVVSQMAETQRQLLTTPIEQLVAQHIIGLRELAILHLQQPNADFEAAQLAIDAIAGVMQTTEGRMGEIEEPLRLDLQQLQMAFVQARDQAGVGADEG